MVHFITRTGAVTKSLLSDFGGAMFLLWRIMANSRHILRDRKLYVQQAMEIGVMSLPLVLLIGTFTGAVSTWQAAYQFTNMVPDKYIGVTTYKAVIVELGPVVSGLVLAGRVGASLAAGLGTMRISEQVDALEVLAIDPVRYLAAPRFIAGVLMFPVLMTLSVFVAVWGGYLVGIMFLDLSFHTFFSEIPVFFKMQDIRILMSKAVTFGFIICLTGTYVGLNTTGGAQGVGRSTIQAFVTSSLLILISDYILAILLF